jgi:hypothetical protein
MVFRDGIDLRIKIAKSSYVTKELFIEYLRDIAIPSIESNRALPECQGRPAIVFGDHCFCHFFDDTLQELTNHGTILITYRPHTSYLSQVLSVFLSGRLKSAKKYLYAMIYTWGMHSASFVPMRSP